MSDATLSALNSEAVVIEGGNSVTLENVDITGSNAKLNGQSTQKTNVLICQSMSGDASEGSSNFTMTGGTVTAKTGSMFHVTNVTTTINLENVDFTYTSDSDFFLDASSVAWVISSSKFSTGARYTRRTPVQCFFSKEMFSLSISVWGISVSKTKVTKELRPKN